MSSEITQSAESLRPKVDRLEHEMLNLPQIEIPVQHGFGPGFYARTITIPAGATITGKVHATEHIFMVTKGDITLITDDGVLRVQAGYQAVCKPGMKRAGHAHTETVCVNIHITEETDLAKLESDLIIAPALEAPEVQEALA
jgi:quercetin dioxygenase-like cupin family protein